MRDAKRFPTTLADRPRGATIGSANLFKRRRLGVSRTVLRG